MTMLARGATDVFISYRRNDIPLLADLLAEKLRIRGVPVFLDVDTIDAGYDWRLAVQRGLARSGTVAVVIGHGWNAARLAHADDVVAYELRLASALGRTVVPVVSR